jgi:phage baseplate assembly protein W
MSTEFLGVGWRFPVGLGEDVAAKPGEDADVALAVHEHSVSQSIWLILRTSPGERVMRPRFGCGLEDYIFSVASAQTASAIAAEVRQALTRWEPRIDVLDVLVTPDNDDAGQSLLIQIAYRVRATNAVLNLVYPFYLGEASG